jgi:glycosyltransferase involved in cell wall biosynthesis
VVRGPLDDGDGLTIVNEQLAELGGAERMIAPLRERFPRALLMAPRFDTTNVPSGKAPRWDEPFRLVGPGGRRHQFLAPFYARRMGRLTPLTGLVLTIGNNSWAHAVALAPGARHVALVHGPPRCLYGHTARYLASEPLAVRAALRGIVPLLRREYVRRMRSPHRRLTVSRWSAGRLERIHGLPWEVVNPPVDSGFFTPAPLGRRAGGPVLVSGRVVPHKRVDRVIEAVRGLDVRLLVAGAGTALEQLRATAPANVRFTGWIEDAALREAYRSASVYVSPVREEFGIALCEAQASGLPVIGPADGGAAEIVRPGVTGRLLPEMTPSALRDAIVAARMQNWDSRACRASALRFTPERFVAGIEAILAEEAEHLGRPVEPQALGQAA